MIKLDETPRVEPVKRMVGGSYGWAYHRFPIKGGISPAKVAALTYNAALMRDIQRPSFASLLIKKPTAPPA